MEIFTPKLIGGTVEVVKVVQRFFNCTTRTNLIFYCYYQEQYAEVMDLVNMFDKLNERCKTELDAIGKQYPFTPLKYWRDKKTLQLTSEEGVKLLKAMRWIHWEILTHLLKGN